MAQAARSGRYENILKFVAETPWAIEAQTWLAIREMLSIRASGEHLSDEEIEARIGGGAGPGEIQMVGSTAILPLSGVIVPRADLFTRVSGGTSALAFQGMFTEALDSKDVKAIVLDVNSPGGSTDLITETASLIRAGRGKKPIVAVANTKMASAAYWIASQADEIVATPSSHSIGSIGVFAAHEDISGMEEKLGLKTTLVQAGRNKTLANPFEPLSDEGRAYIQEMVDEQYAQFTADVAKGRKVTVSTVRDEGSPFGEGKTFGAKAALKAGLVDRIETIQATVERLATGRTAPMPVEQPDSVDVADGGDAEGRHIDVTITADTSQFDAATFVAQANALRASADNLVDRAASLAEVARGHLTGAKRESLTACTEALSDAVSVIEGVLAATEPNRDKREAEREHLAFLHAQTL